MSRTIAFALLFLPLLAAQNGGTVEGVVVSTVTGLGIPGVGVTVFTRQSLRYETHTSDSGAFRVTDISEGTYEVRLEKDGYNRGKSDPPAPYRVTSGQGPIRLRLEMTRLVTIRGRVLDHNGKPVPQAQVRLDSRNPGTPTAEDGAFAITDVPPGFHTLLASPPAGSAPNSEEERIEPIPTYFPSAIDPVDAQRIVVRDDTDLVGQDIRLQTAAVHRVRGVVLSETATPVGGATVQIHPSIRQGLRVVFNFDGAYIAVLAPGSSYGLQESQLTTGADGVFEFPSVRSGEWQITASTMKSIDSPDFAQSIRSGALTTFVGKGDLDNQQVRLGVPFTLRGTTEWKEVPSHPVSVMLINANSGGLLSPPSLFGNTPERLTLSARPGRYYLMPTFAAGSYPASVILDGREVLGQPVDLLGGSPAFQVVYKSAQGIVRGKVEPGTAFVVLLPDRITSMGLGRMERPKADGTYEMAGVPPGDYYVAAFTGPDLRESADSTILERVLLRGTRVKVEQTGTVTLDLKPIRWLE